MAIAHDTSLLSAQFTTVSPFTFTYTPIGTPKGIKLSISHGEVTTDLITGAVTYGGVAMTREISEVDATDGEVGRVYEYFLGAGIPTGAQTVSITHTGSVNLKVAHCASVTAATNTEIVHSDSLVGTIVDPQITFNVGSESIAYYSVLSGFSSPAALDLIAGQTSMAEHDFGAYHAEFARETSPATGSRTVGWTNDPVTPDPDDVCMTMVVIREVPSASGQAPRSMHQFRLRRVA